jgi:hypothetical protein
MRHLKIFEDFGQSDSLKENPFPESKVKKVVWRAGTIDQDNNALSGGIWFGETKEGVEKFCISVRRERREGKPYFINLQNPAYFDSFWHGYIREAHRLDYQFGRKMLKEKLQKQGHDGIIIEEDTWNDTGDEYSVSSEQYIVFDPENIKPANIF